jgi:dTDP-4-amino-4,6-dideoxygalactose transaminase
MDLDAIQVAITDNTRAIVATHMFGYPADIEAIRECAGDRQIVIIEDGAWTFPGSTRSPAGLRSDSALFSFGPGKPLYGVSGGAIVTNNSVLYGRLKAYRDSEMSRLTTRQWAKRWARMWLRFVLNWDFVYRAAQRWSFVWHAEGGPALRLQRSGGPAGTSYDALPCDLATRLADFQARLGLNQLLKSEVLLHRRRTVASMYGELLENVPGLIPAPLVKGACYALYSARVRGRDEWGLVQKMRQSAIGVATTYGYAVPGLARFRPFAEGTYPMAEQAAREVVNLPVSSDLSDEQIVYVAACVRRTLASASGSLGKLAERVHPIATADEGCALP